MTHPFLACLVVIGLAAGPVIGQNAAGKGGQKAWTPPKTSWGDPDLQGEWPASANIPLQRPATLADKAALTDQELAQRQQQAQKLAQADSEEFVKGGAVPVNPPSYWQDRGKPNRQTSLVVDPPDGRIPALTAEGAKTIKELRGGRGPGTKFNPVIETWEDFDTYSRCISRGVVSSMLPYIYNFGNEIIQAPGYVVIRNEMIHEARVIPLDGRPHVGQNISMYMGDSRGHWEGSTLVIETTNLKQLPGAGDGIFSDAARLTERLTRVAAGELSYDVTINDPKMWTKPWTIHMPYKLDPSYKIYEYACHEGNYMMVDALTSSRDAKPKP
jgi:hypothetical protein